MPIDLVIDEREGGTKLEGLPGESSSTDLRTTLTSSKNFIGFDCKTANVLCFYFI